MATFEDTLDRPSIEVVPGAGVFSALDILELVCQVWKPSGGRAATVRLVMCNYLNTPTPTTRLAFCEAISGEGFDDELNNIVAEAMAYATAEVLGTIGDLAGLAGANCAVYCDDRGATADYGNLVQNVAMIAINSYSGDGVDWGGLATSAGKFALTQAACCAVSYGVSIAARAAQIHKVVNLSAILGQFRRACSDLIASGAAAGAAVPGVPGWTTTLEPTPPPRPPPPTTPGQVTPEAARFWELNRLALERMEAARLAREAAAAGPTPFSAGSPPPPPPSPPPPPPTSKNWLPLAVTFAGAGVATILIVRRRN